MYLGVKAVVAKSIERIHAANLVNFGILPLTFADPADYDRVEQGDEFEIPGVRRGPGRAASRWCWCDTTKGVDIALRLRPQPAPAADHPARADCSPTRCA